MSPATTLLGLLLVAALACAITPVVRAERRRRRLALRQRPVTLGTFGGGPPQRASMHDWRDTEGATPREWRGPTAR
jgi:hypothetical protein